MSKTRQDLNIGPQLRKIRKGKNMSLHEVSNLSGVPVGTVGDIERERATNPSFASVVKICKALNTSPLSLITENNEDINTETAEISDIKYLYDFDYLKLFRDENFKPYFEATKLAYLNNISSNALTKIIEVIAENKQQ